MGAHDLAQQLDIDRMRLELALALIEGGGERDPFPCKLVRRLPFPELQRHLPATGDDEAGKHAGGHGPCAAHRPPDTLPLDHGRGDQRPDEAFAGDQRGEHGIGPGLSLAETGALHAEHDECLVRRAHDQGDVARRRRLVEQFVANGIIDDDEQGERCALLVAEPREIADRRLDVALDLCRQHGRGKIAGRCRGKTGEGEIVVLEHDLADAAGGFAADHQRPGGGLGRYASARSTGQAVQAGGAGGDLERQKAYSVDGPPERGKRADPFMHFIAVGKRGEKVAFLTAAAALASGREADGPFQPGSGKGDVEAPGDDAPLVGDGRRWNLLAPVGLFHRIDEDMQTAVPVPAQLCYGARPARGIARPCPAAGDRLAGEVQDTVAGIADHQHRRTGGTAEAAERAGETGEDFAHDRLRSRGRRDCRRPDRTRRWRSIPSGRP